MDKWKPIDSAPKDGTGLLLWVTRFGTTPAGQSEPAPVVGFWHGKIERWKVAPEYLNREEDLHPSHWMELPKPPGES
jgi:hypothetical protein